MAPCTGRRIIRFWSITQHFNFQCLLAKERSTLHGVLGVFCISEAMWQVYPGADAMHSRHRLDYTIIDLHVL